MDANENNEIPNDKTLSISNDPQKKSIATIRQAKTIEKLFEAIDEPVDIPPPSYAQGSSLKPPPDFVRTSGAVAGASSLEFQIYRNLRRKEAIRLQEMEDSSKMEEEKRLYEEKRALQRLVEEERTAKKRAQRQKKKQNKKQKIDTSIDRDEGENETLDNKEKVLAPLPNVTVDFTGVPNVPAVSKNILIIEDE